MGECPGQAGGKPAYHHGDLRNALIEAATGLAREGGPDAVVLRAAARQVGVSPTAAYRHFAGQADLLFAVKVRGQQALAESMERAAAAAPDTDGGAAPPGAEGEAATPGGGATVEQRMAAMGRGYVSFAMEEPGLFRAAFCDTPELAAGMDEHGMPEPSPDGQQFRSVEMLVEILDGLQASGRMPPRRRAGAEVTAWAMVHGLAVLMLDGPFALLPVEAREATVARALETLMAGFTAP